MSALRKLKANLDISNHQGLTPYSMAIKHNNRESAGRSQAHASDESNRHNNEFESPGASVVAETTASRVGTKGKKEPQACSVIPDLGWRSQSDKLPRRVGEGKRKGEEEEEEGRGREVKGERGQGARTPSGRGRERSHSDKQERKRKPQAA